MSAINQLDIEEITESVQKFADMEEVNGFVGILIGFTDEGGHTCIIGKGKLNRANILCSFSNGIKNLFEKMDAFEQDGGVQ